MTIAVQPVLRALRERLALTRYVDRPRLARELDRLFARKSHDPHSQQAIAALGAAIETSIAHVERLRSLPASAARRISCAARPWRRRGGRSSLSRP